MRIIKEASNINGEKGYAINIPTIIKKETSGEVLETSGEVFPCKYCSIIPSFK